MKIKDIKSNLPGSRRMLCVLELDSKSLGFRIYDKYNECTSIQVDKSKLIKFIDKVRDLKEEGNK